ncbi:hypothetical protein E3E22_08290 [Thermococcus sp. MV5]|uniref:hypothetical protein n=1 Tax=Thermococcus sp. MV5 TaxID=1638272 RepID=UPI00143BAAD7|nr:hypothetical protein [Thermococcus sp. MV5]NJE26613.1 hypothetical protein [Thermococcus sp. MV5]
MLDLLSLTKIDISVLVLVAGAIFYYFGRLIADTHVEQPNKPASYVTGFVFVVFFIVVPSIFVYYLQNYLRWIPLIVLILLQIVFFSLLWWTTRIYEYFWKHSLLETFQDAYQKKFEEIKQSDTHLGSFLRNYEDTIKKTLGDPLSFFIRTMELTRRVSSNYLFLILASFLSILSIKQAIRENSIVFAVTSSILAFFIFTMIALVYGFSTAYYPPAVIYLRDGEILRGKLLKFGDFVYLLDEDRKVKVFVNKQEIKYLEESLFKNQWPENQSKSNKDLTSI